MKPEVLYDREKERRDLNSFLLDQNIHYVIVHGESGAGKSHIITNCLSEKAPHEIIPFTFMDAEDEWGSPEHDFKDFIHSLYLEYRSKRDAFVETIKRSEIDAIGIGLSGPSLDIRFDKKTITINERYICQLTEKLQAAGVKVLWLSNLELVQKDDIELVKIIVNSKQKSIKIVLEVGTLASEHKNIVEFVRKNSNADEIEVENFNKFHATEFYKITRGHEPPAELYGCTLGNPLCITHFSHTLDRPSIDRLIDRKLQNVSVHQLELVYLMHIFHGETNRQWLKKTYSGENFGANIESLENLDIVQCKGECVTYAHAHIARSVSRRSRSVYMESLRLKVVERLTESADDWGIEQLGFITKQYLHLDKRDLAIQFGWKAILLAYRNQAYQYIRECTGLLLGVIGDKDAVAYLEILNLQSLILLGNAANSREVSFEFRQQSGFEPYLQLLEAQRLYQSNKFNESIDVVDSLMEREGNDDSIMALAHGVNASSYIGLGNKEKAESHFAAAELLAPQCAVTEYRLELSRLKPKIYGFELGSEMLKHDIEANEGRGTDYTLAKCYHNFGFSNFLISMEDNGALDKAQRLFEKILAPELTYTMVARSIVLLAQNRFNDACDILFDALNLCHEQYDRFAVHANIGNCHLLSGCTDKAGEHYEEALKALQHGTQPLEDPVLVNKAYHNLALFHCHTMRWDTADHYVQKIEVPDFSHFPEARRTRVAELSRHIEKRKRMPLERDAYDIRQWPVTRFACALAKLSFYDFNSRTIPYDFLPSSLMPLSFDLPAV